MTTRRSSTGPQDRRFGAQLCSLRKQARLSLSDLAARTHYSRGYLSKIENGLKSANDKLAKACDDALNTGGVLAKLVAERQPPPSWISTAQPVDLPPAARVFKGREEELSRITAALTTERTDVAQVVVVAGMPGVGKTELAVQAAGRLLAGYPDGCLFLALRGHSAPLATADAIRRILRRLGLPGEAIPHDLDERLSLYRQVIRDRRLLLVLDDVTSAEQVRVLTPPGGACDVLATSRHRLPALDEARHLMLKELDWVTARQLFQSLAAAVPSGDDRMIDNITARCGGLPLAVRIAAARHRSSSALPLDELARQVENERWGLDALDDGERSVIATFASATDNLSAQLADLFALLSLHPGGDFDARTAAVLADADASVRQMLDGLVDACLIGGQRSGRYAFHDLVRSYAKRLADARLTPVAIDVAQARLVSGYVHIAQHADITITPDRHREPAAIPAPASWNAIFTGPGAAAQWFEDEQDALVAVCELAVKRGDDAACWRLAYALRDFYFRTKLWDHWIHTHRLALAAARRSGHRWAIAVTLNNLGLAYAETAQYDLADVQYTEALKTFRALGDRYGEANTIGHQAWVRHCLGAHTAAIELATAALRFYEEQQVHRNRAITLRTLALAEAVVGRTADALDHLRLAQQIFSQAGLVLDEAMAWNCLGEVHSAAGSPSRATRSFRRALDCARAGGSAYEEGRAWGGLAAAAAAAGRPEEAERLVEKARELSAGRRTIPRQSRDASTAEKSRSNRDG